MNILDILIVILLIAAAISGYRKGVIVQVFAIAGILLGIFLAYRLGRLIGDIFNIGEPYASALNFAIVFLVVWGVLVMIGRLCKALIRSTVLSIFERLGGLLLSVALYALIMGVLLGLIEKINDNHRLFDRKFFGASAIYPPLRDAADTIFPYLVEKGDRLLDEAKSDEPIRLPAGRNNDNPEEPTTEEKQ